MKGKIFFTADEHYDHQLMVKRRGFTSTHDMNECLYEAFNAIVPYNGLTYHLGDFAFKNHVEHISKLNGNHILLRGNHDRMSAEAKSHFVGRYDLKEIRHNKEKIFLCHYPMKSWNASCHGRLSLYGHWHGRLAEDRLAFDVGVDCWNLYPISIELVMFKKEWLKNNLQEYTPVDNYVNNITLNADIHAQYVASVTS